MTDALPLPTVVVGSSAISTEIAERLEQHAQQAAGAISPNTIRAINADFGIFQAWCNSHGQSSLPATPKAVRDFIDAMARGEAVTVVRTARWGKPHTFGGGNRKPATIRRYVSSIAAVHRAAKLENPCDTDRHEIVRWALKRMYRSLGRRQDQARPLNERDLLRILFFFDALPERTPKDLRDRALICAAYDTLARREELVALRVEDFDRGDALTDPHDGSGSMTIR